MTLEGFTLAGLLGRKTYRWSWIYFCWPWPRRLELLMAGDGVSKWDNCPPIAAEHVPALLRHPSFPKWLLSASKAVQYGLSKEEAAAFGPPGETRWTVGGVTKAADQNAAMTKGEDPKTAHEFILWVDRVGTFDRGVAFAFAEETRVVPWWRLGINPEPSEEGGVAFMNGPTPENSTDLFVVTKEQAKAILSTHEAAKVTVPPSIKPLLA